MAIDNYTPEQIEEILQMFFDVAGTRQYIGARYVPIFGRGRGTSVNWDNSDAYEPLSIVYYQGDTYTSRRYVPAGIQIDNQDYWVITGRYNAQVEQYRQEVLRFQGQIDTLRDDLESDYVPFPDPDHYPKYGTTGQVLSTLADGTTKWDDPVVPSDAQAEEVITTWLNDHPEATTTVQDNSLSISKLTMQAYNTLSGYYLTMPTSNYYVTYNTQADTLTIPADSVVMGRTSYYVVPSAVTLSCANVGSSLIKLNFNISTHEFSLLPYVSNNPNFDTVTLGTFRKAGTNTRFTASFPWMVNDLPYDIPKDYADETYKLLMPGYSVVSVDAANNTITFPADCIVVGSTYRYVFPSAVTVNMASVASSAKAILFNLSTHAITVRSYDTNTPSPYDQIILCLVRRVSASSCHVTADFPYTINGNPFDIKPQWQYMPFEMRSINHQGWSNAPRNTITAFKQSIEHNYNYVETDVRQTSDGVLVLLHDETINSVARNADGTEISETIYISDITYAEALQYDFGISKGAQYAGTKISKFDDFMKFCKLAGLHAYVEGKIHTQAFAQEVVDCIERHGMVDKSTYISISLTILEYVHTLNADLRLGYILFQDITSNEASRLIAIRDDNEVFVDMSISYVSTSVSTCIQNSLPMETFVVDDPTILHAMDPYVSGVTTNYLDVGANLRTYAMNNM